MNLLVTGSSGFIGRALVVHASTLPAVNVIACSRRPCPNLPSGVRTVEVAGYDDAAMAAALEGVTCVVHAAGMAHVDVNDGGDGVDAFRRANVHPTSRLARQAVASGVSRFVFLSSIGVNGESSLRPFTEADQPAPVSPYAVAKLEAEQELRRISRDTSLDVVIVRPPLVYGADAPGNFGKLIRLARSGVPLPFGGIRNRRSLVGIDTLCGFLALVTLHAAAANQTFLVAESGDVATPDLIAVLRRAMGMSPRLFWVPAPLLGICLKSAGGRRLGRQLRGDLQVSTSKARELLHWVSPQDTISGLHSTGLAFRRSA